MKPRFFSKQDLLLSPKFSQTFKFKILFQPTIQTFEARMFVELESCHLSHFKRETLSFRLL